MRRRFALPGPETFPVPQGRLAWWLTVLGAGCIGFQLWMGLTQAHRHPLSGDEALYAYWARHWWETRDPLFLAHWIDKPPVYLWIQTGAFALWGPTSAAARYVNILAHILLTLVLGLYAGRTWNWMAGALGLLLATLNPLLLAHAATGLTDSVLLLWSALTVLLAWERRWFASGLTLALAVFTKQAGVFIAPLVLGVMIIRRPGAWRDWGRWLAGAAVIALPIQIWDMLRWPWAPSFWSLGFDHYAPLFPLPAAAWSGRVEVWSPLWRFLWGSGMGWWGWLMLLAPALWQARHAVRASAGRLMLWLALWLCGYGFVHLAFNFNAWIRYLLPVMPLLILSASWAVGTVWRAPRSPWRTWVSGAGAVMLLLASLVALPQVMRQTVPEGPRHRALAGLPEATAYLASHAPAGSALLHHELSWHYLFYLFDHPSLPREWYADPAALIQRVQALPVDQPKFQLRLRRDAETTREISRRLSAISLHHVPCIQFEQVTVYAIQHRATDTCEHLNPP